MADGKKKREYTCSLCGPFSRHTKRGHLSATNTMFALQAEELRSWVLSNVVDRVHKNDAMRVALLGPPTADTSADHLINCPGRNYFALLLHRREVVNRCRLNAPHVFAWARMLSDGTHTDTENPPGSVVAAAATEVAAAAAAAASRQAQMQPVMAPSSPSDGESSSSCSRSSSRSSSPSPRASPSRGAKRPPVHDGAIVVTPSKRGRRPSSVMALPGLAAPSMDVCGPMPGAIPGMAQGVTQMVMPAGSGRVRVVPMLLQVPPDSIPAVLRFVADLVTKEEHMVELREAAAAATAAAAAEMHAAAQQAQQPQQLQQPQMLQPPLQMQALQLQQLQQQHAIHDVAQQEQQEQQQPPGPQDERREDGGAGEASQQSALPMPIIE